MTHIGKLLQYAQKKNDSLSSQLNVKNEKRKEVK